MKINPDFANTFQLWDNKNCIDARDERLTENELLAKLKELTNRGDTTSVYYFSLIELLQKTGEYLSYGDIFENTKYYDKATKTYINFTQDDWVNLVKKQYGTKFTPETEVLLNATVKNTGVVLKKTASIVKLINLISLLYAGYNDINNLYGNKNQGKLPFIDTTSFVLGYFAGQQSTLLFNFACIAIFGIVTVGTGAVACTIASFIGGTLVGTAVNDGSKFILNEVLTVENSVLVYNNYQSFIYNNTPSPYLNEGVEEYLRRLACAFNSCY